MDIKAMDLPPRKVAYLRYTGPFGPAIGSFWRDVFNPWRAAHGLMARTTYGVAQDDPSTTPPERCRYDACVEVDEGYAAEAPAATAVLPGGRYAVAAYRGDASGIGAAWGAFYSQALPASGYETIPGPCFERYPADYSEDAATGVFQCELCIPIK
ncbi:AraC family transcriptional regulator [Pseudoduganella aquatica]|uniref:AraC family transcriptional regulator n=1 Tax=Pseudoduganella aquatica TaxID=2660641 RepID=A0A7X4HFL0_9BURK|nr:GyrI-like domain-containing protein [Pseudoduganella aquatica]MYN10341.1 AraC family transcriptional regulator [Pseudoduganella aquatica]